MRTKWTMLLSCLCLLASATARADTPGVTATEIKIGATFPWSGPASPLSNSGKGMAAYITYLNDRGGINGRKINLVTYDDAYLPAKSVEQTRKLIESDEVAFMFGSLGTPAVAATIKYVNSKKVPHLFVATGVSKFADFTEFPMTTTGLPSYRTEGAIYARYMAETLPNAKIAILYQNDDLGRDFIAAYKEYFQADYDKRVVALSYEVADPTVDSQIIKLKASGAEAFLLAGTPKFGAQAIRKASEIGWKPLFIINTVAGSVSAGINVAGPENAVGVITAAVTKDATDPSWDSDPNTKWYKDFFTKYLAGGDIGDANYSFGTGQGEILEQVLKQCGDDLSRANILKQSRNIRDFAPRMAVPGLRVNTNEKNSAAFTQLQLQRWTGTGWKPFGGVRSAN